MVTEWKATLLDVEEGETRILIINGHREEVVAGESDGVNEGAAIRGSSDR